MMDAEEREVYFYLKGNQDQYLPANLICRHAGGKQRFRDAADWARPALLRMLERGIIEANASGAFRLKPMEQDSSTTRKWVSPQIAAILKSSGKKFDNLRQGEDDMDAYYNSL